MPEPESLARIAIDRQLEAAGWLVQDRDALNLFAGPGIAIREVSIPGAGEADSHIVADRKADDLIEAKVAGTQLPAPHINKIRIVDIEHLVSKVNWREYATVTHLKRVELLYLAILWGAFDRQSR